MNTKIATKGNKATAFARTIAIARTLKFTLPIAAVALSLAAGAAHAQDTRNVSEPSYPPACSVLRAALAARPGILPADEPKLDTARIQAALDACPKGQAVELQPDKTQNAFLSGPLDLRPGVTLLVARGATLFGSRNPADYAIAKGSCGLVNDQPRGCRPLIAARDATGSAIMGDGAIDGRGGAPILADGKSTFKSWWDLAEQARAGGRQQVPRLIETDKTDNFTLYRITLRNSANFHVVFHHGDGFTAWAVKIDTPKRARNTDGIDPSGSRNITVTQSWIRAGDDNIAIKGGDAPTTNMTVSHNHFFWGHGMSIGSETSAGVSAIRVTDLSLDAPDNGLRIKSNPTRGGLVHDVVYDDVCIRDSKAPIFLETAYTYPGNGKDLLPVYQDITLHNVSVTGGGKIQLNGLDKTHRVGVRFDGVLLGDGASAYRIVAQHADIAYGPGPVNFIVSGEDVTAAGKPTAAGAPPACAAKFARFPSP